MELSQLVGILDLTNFSYLSKVGCRHRLERAYSESVQKLSTKEHCVGCCDDLQCDGDK